MTDNSKRRIKIAVRVGLAVLFSPIIIPFTAAVFGLMAIVMGIHSLVILIKMTGIIVVHGWDGHDGADTYWTDAWYNFRREYLR